jgi:hypothetical protein
MTHNRRRRYSPFRRTNHTHRADDALASGNENWVVILHAGAEPANGEGGIERKAGRALDCTKGPKKRLLALTELYARSAQSIATTSLFGTFETC